MAENKKAVWQSMFISIFTAILVMWLFIWVADLLFPGLAHWPGRTPWLFAITGGIGGFFGTIPQTHYLTKASLPHIREALAKRNLPVITPMNSPNASEADY